MIVPPSELPSTAPGGLMKQDAPAKPSPAMLLMAAAAMHQMGKMGRGQIRRGGKGHKPPSSPDESTDETT